MKPDRSDLAARGQLEAMGVDSFEVGVHDQAGRVLIRTWSKDKVLESLPWLKRENAKGADVYVSPYVLRHRQAVFGSGGAERPQQLHRSRQKRARTHERARPYPRHPYRHGLKSLYARFGASMDVSKADYMIGVDMAKRGFSADQIGKAIEQASPQLPTRKAGHEANYVARTVKAVMNHPEVKQQERPAPRHERGNGPSLG